MENHKKKKNYVFEFLWEPCQNQGSADDKMHAKLPTMQIVNEIELYF